VLVLAPALQARGNMVVAVGSSELLAGLFETRGNIPRLLVRLLQ
jgi:hypothetical protein